jgi:hypothetical protein
MCRLTRFACGRLIFPRGKTPENRHNNQPSVGELVIAHDGVSVVDLPNISKTFEYVICYDRAIEHHSGRVKARPLFCEDRHPGVHDLDYVIWANRQ